MNSTSVTVSPTPGNILDDFEEAYQKCLGPLVKEDPFTCVDLSELQTNAETNTAHFMEMAKAMQAFFLQKRFQLAAQKPELVMMEDAVELRGELARKDELIKKQSDKLAEWQATINALQNKIGGVNTNTQSNTANQTAPQQPQQPMGSMPSAMMGTGGMGSRGAAMMPQQGMGNTPSSMSAVGHLLSSGSSMTSNQQVGMSSMDNNGGPNRAGMQPHMGSGGNSPHMVMGGVHSPNSSLMTGGQVGGGGAYSGGGIMGGYGQPAPPYQQLPPQGLQGPLAYLEKTTTNIGMP